ncbi:unnamed protein product [Protopolystoma xenopodis]|uniref:Uncharacterized protein n=1 Tax=Protopolystoma xenopodis TaxID=117903 RepID=A0A3S4ZZA7_9PLAT|nr:unnamed protein product [Protopolystoma xenopodis]
MDHTVATPSRPLNLVIFCKTLACLQHENRPGRGFFAHSTEPVDGQGVGAGWVLGPVETSKLMPTRCETVWRQSLYL